MTPVPIQPMRVLPGTSCTGIILPAPTVVVEDDILFELITEWPAAKQAMFTFATVMEDKLLGDD
jgi:hypothetical protein